MGRPKYGYEARILSTNEFVGNLASKPACLAWFESRRKVKPPKVVCTYHNRVTGRATYVITTPHGYPVATIGRRRRD